MNFSNLKNLLSKALKFGPYIPVASILTGTGQRFLSHKFLEKINKKRIRKINKHLLPLIEESNKLVVPETQGSIRGFAKECDNTTSSDSKIWFCWLQGEENLPPIARMCLENLRKNANGHEVVVLTANNLHDYVKLPVLIENLYKEGKLKQAHYADLLRINVLAQQGGLWLDSTIFVAKPLPDEIFSRSFWSVKNKPFGYFVSRCRWSVFALAAQKNNILFLKLAKAFEIYLNKTSVFIDYFLFDHFIDLFYQTDLEIMEMIDGVPINNPAVHELNKRLCDDFDEQWWGEATKDTFIFKLNNRTYTQEQLEANPNSFFAKLPCKI